MKGVETVIRCDECKRIIDDDFDECCEGEYTELYECEGCGEFVEELEGGRCQECPESGFEQTTWSMFYSTNRVYK